MDYYFIIYFLAGLLQDFILTLNLRFIAKDKVIPAAISSFIVTIITLLVIYNILTQLETQKTIIAIIVYALGIGVGTFLAMKVKSGFKD